MKALFRRSASLVLLLAALPAFASEAATTQKPIAVQMYTLRNAGSLDQQLKIVHDAGVRAVETVGTQNTSATELKQLLDRYSIKAVSSHVPLAELRGNLDGVVTFNRSIGNSTLVVPYLDQKDRPTDAAGWTALGKELGRIAKQVRGKGMRLAYHNHDFELADFDGQTGLELLFAAAGPDLQTELDLAWVARAGLDPAVMLGKFRGRVFAVHARTMRPRARPRTKTDSPPWARACWTGTRSCPPLRRPRCSGTSSNTTSHATRPRSSRPARTTCVNTCPPTCPPVHGADASGSPT